MYEVEIKVELTAPEKDKALAALEKMSFSPTKVTPQHDVYVKASASPYGGFNIERYRNEAGKFIYTKKTWEMVEDKPVRKEEQRNLSKEEFESALAEFPQALSIRKNRQWFKGIYEGREVSITVDTVKFDHSPKERYFMEAEIDVKEKGRVLTTQEFITELIKNLLEKSTLEEAPSMFEMAFKKL